MTCSATFATFRLFEDDLDPDRITALLGLQPTGSHRTGDRRGAAVMRAGSWRLTTDGRSGSVDVRDHVDLLLDQLEPVAAELAVLRAEGVRSDVFCYWATDRGHGGPALDPSQMGRLAHLQLPIGFDCYRLPPPTDP